MKKIFLFMMALMPALFSLANDEKPLIVSAGHLNRIELGSDMKVTFINAATFQNELKTNQADVFENLNISVYNGNMRIELRRKAAKNQKIVVVVEDLQSLTIDENTIVDSENDIPGQQIKINIADQSFVRLTTPARVKAYGPDGLPIDVQTRPISIQKNKPAF